MDKLIELREVTAGYGNKIALRNVTLDVWKNAASVSIVDTLAMD